MLFCRLGVEYPLNIRVSKGGGPMTAILGERFENVYSVYFGVTGLSLLNVKVPQSIFIIFWCCSKDDCHLGCPGGDD